MIHAFALEPELVATWSKRQEFRFVCDKFGLGTPRVLLELPAFTKWKRAVYDAAIQLAAPQEDMKRLEELFRLFSEHKCRRADSIYDGLLSWLENAEREHDRQPFAGIAAVRNPRGHHAVLVSEQLDQSSPRWSLDLGASPARTPEALAAAISAMLMNCRELHLVDPHWGPENARHRKVLEAIIAILAKRTNFPDIVCIHCSADAELRFFDRETANIASRLPLGIKIEFARWKRRHGGEKLHNRFVLTDLGGILLGVGLDAGEAGESDDLLLLPRAQYEKRWSQYTRADEAFDLVDRPAPLLGARAARASNGPAR